MISCTNQSRLPVTAICMLALLAFMTGCAPLWQPPASLPPAPPVPERPAPPVPPAPVPEPAAPLPPSEPRHVASLQLTDQGRMLLEKKRFDDAIRTLEQAVGLNPQSGENYFYLAEAWLAKGSFKQAEEFHRLASMYLTGPVWSERLSEQRSAIDAGRMRP